VIDPSAPVPAELALIPPARIVFSPEDRARILALIDAALQSGSLTLGECGRQLESQFAQLHAAPHAVAVASGSAALEIVLRCVGVQGGEVIVPANTFFATAAAVVHAGGRPRFADVEAPSLAVSAETVSVALTPETVAVVVVHIGGLISPQMDAIADLCRQRGVVLIEDAAHAHGASLDGHPAGTWGRAATWSFYPTKVITSAEGGIITTSDGAIADAARLYRDQGKASFLGGGHVAMGSAWRMSELHAAVGLVHLSRLGEFVATRRRIGLFYDSALRGLRGLELLAAPARCASNYYKYPVLLAPGIDRATFKRRLRQDFGVACSGEVYATPLHLEPVFADVSHPPLPAAEDLCARQVCLPVHSDMTEDEAARVVDALRLVLAA